MRVAVYVRVSTDKQEADNQLVQLREYVARSGWEVTKEYIDIISGREKSRPGFDELFQDAYMRKFELVLFWALDRFSRAGVLHTLQKLQELERLGIGWESYTEVYFKSAGQFKDVVVSIMATLAKIEAEKISERTKAGLERARREGKILGRPKVQKYRVKSFLYCFAQGKGVVYCADSTGISRASGYRLAKSTKK